MLRDAPLQEPMSVVGDGNYRRIMSTDELSEVLQKTLCLYEHRGVAQLELLDDFVYEILLLVPDVRVHYRETVNVVPEHALRYRNDRVRIDATAHTEGQWDVCPQP